MEVINEQNLATKPYRALNLLLYMYYVYLIKRKKKIYIGYTEDLIRRLKEHKVKKQELIYYEAYKDEIDARSREIKLKQRGQTVRFLKERVKRSLKE